MRKGKQDRQQSSSSRRRRTRGHVGTTRRRPFTNGTDDFHMLHSRVAAAQNKESQQQKRSSIQYLVVLDFEATCDRRGGPPRRPQEIIEFPSLLLNIETGLVESTFHHYVRPDVHPTLSEFCTQLTGITQDMVDYPGLSLEKVLIMHQEWLDENHLVSEAAAAAAAAAAATTENIEESPARKKFLYLTCGSWDLKQCLPSQLKFHDQEVPAGFRDWINVKHVFADFYGNSKQKGMVSMLNYLGLRLQGRHHSGIDDCRNIARIVAQMLEDGWIPETQFDWR